MRRFPTTRELVTLQLTIDVADPDLSERPAWEFARDRGLAVTTHAGAYKFNPDLPAKLLKRAGLLDSTTTFAHATVMSDESYRIIADSGASISVATESDLHAGQGYPVTNQARKFGVNTTLSVDTVTWFSGDMFSAMRSTLGADRALAHMEARAKDEVVTSNALRATDVVGYATIDGARSLGMDSQLGSVTAGKQADLVVLDASSASMVPHSNPIGSVVLQAGRGEVDTVLIGGRVLKQGGELVDSQLKRARHLAEQSRDRLFKKVGADQVRDFLNPPRR